MIRVRIDLTEEPIGELHIQRDATDKDGNVGNYTVEHYEKAWVANDTPTRSFRVEGFNRNRGAYALTALALSQYMFEVDK